MAYRALAEGSHLAYRDGGRLDLQPWAGQRGVFLVGVDRDQGQEGSDEKSTGVGSGDPVGVGPSLHEGACLLVGLHDVLAGLRFRDLLLGLPALDGDPFLFGLQQAHWDGVGVGHLHEFEAFGFEAGDPPLSARDPLRVVLVAEHHRLQIASHRLAVQSVQMDPEVPGALDPVLDVGG